MKGINMYRNIFHPVMRNDDFNSNDVKISELRLDYDYSTLPIIETNKEKRYSLKSNESNNFQINVENKQG